MKLELKLERLSLKPFASEDLPDFVVITGKNGSGKSQLLTLIHKESNPSGILIVDSSVKRIQYEGIVKTTTETITINEWNGLVQNIFDQYKNIISNQDDETLNAATFTKARKIYQYLTNNNLVEQAKRYRTRPFLLSEDKVYKELIGVPEDTPKNLPPRLRTIQQHALNFFINLENNNVKIFDFVGEILKHNPTKKEHELTQMDFYTIPISDKFIDTSDLFNSRTELIFYSYAKRRAENNLAYFNKKEYGEQNNALSDSEFVATNTPPWIIINKILKDHKVDFRFNEIGRNFNPAVSIDFRLIKSSTGDTVGFQNLSSGEQVIIGLILKLFTSEYYNYNLSLPDLLLLDEPDAYLHPEMSKLLIDVLNDTFVKKLGIKVIITTHSPSTVALCPEEALYQLTNGINTSLKKVSKDEALKLLTGFIPTLSIDYKNHRQIFVESPTDRLYYQYLHDRHQQERGLSYKLYFISNGFGKGNSNQVYEIVKQLRDTGNKTCYGIVDWDKEKKPTEFVKVHGINERWSIENFILDPVYVLILLIEMRAFNVHEMLGINQLENQYLLGEKTNEELQRIVNIYFDLFKDKYKAKSHNDTITVEYFNNRKIKMPKWYLEDRGHDIADKVYEVFEPLKRKYSHETDLLNALSLIAAKCYPFLPISTISLIEELSSQ